MDKKQLRLIIALIWIVSILVFVAALTALAKTVSASPAESIHRRALKLIEDKTVPESKEKKYVELSAEKEALKQKLTEEQYNVCFNAATEPPFTGKYWDNHEPGTYHCVVCETPLFSSTTKFDSGTGWPSFYDAVDEGAIELREDRTHGMVRTETLCANCGAHLGHIFNDGPKPTGMRYCINSAALDFRPTE